MWPFLKPFHAFFRQFCPIRGAATPAVPPAAPAHKRPAAQTPLPQQHVANVVQQVLCYQQIQAHAYDPVLADKHRNRLIDETLVILKTVSLTPRIRDSLQTFVNQELGLSPFAHKGAHLPKAAFETHSQRESVQKQAATEKDIQLLKGKILFYDHLKSHQRTSGHDLNPSKLKIIDDILAFKKSFSLPVALDKELGAFMAREFDGCSLIRVPAGHNLQQAHLQSTQAEPIKEELPAAKHKNLQKPETNISDLVSKVSQFDAQMRKAARESYAAYTVQISELVNQCAMALQNPALQDKHRETLATFVDETFGSYNLAAAYSR